MSTVTDFFCGMGGSSTGLASAGFDVKLAANHWDRAIETHSANHPDTEHLLGDLQAVDVRYLPRTDVLWASPICTEVSPAGGRRKKGAELDLFEQHGHVPTAAFERTRVTFWEVIRAAEVHQYPIVLIENVVEAADWELFDVWLAGMTTLGYEHQFISVSAAHIDGGSVGHAPQWRDRLYIAFNRHGMRRPDVEPRPLAWCEKCGTDVAARQWWKRNGRHIGKYGAQYLYVCPEGGHGVVEPYVAPAAAAINWTDLGNRIGDRARPLAAGTMRRIQAGLDMLARGDFGGEFVMAVNHDGDGRHYDPHGRPMPTQTVKRGEGLVVAAAGNTYDAASRGDSSGYLRAWPADGAPMPAQTTTGQLGVVIGGAGEQRATSLDAPLRTQRASGADFLVTLRRNARPTSVNEPAATFTASGFHHGLVIPFRRGSRAYPAARGPLSTMATRDQHGVLKPAYDIQDARFRMLTPREAANAQAFPGSYIIHGNKGEQQMQAGNAVAVNVAAWLGAGAMRVLDAA